MDRRNFFALAGAAGLALTAGAATADERGAAMPAMMGRGGGASGLARVAKSLAGTAADHDIVRIAMTGSGGGAALDEEWDMFCGNWYIYIHNGPIKGDWQDATKVFGRNFAKLSLSQMVSVASQSRFGGENLSLKVGRDGGIMVAGG